MTDLISEYICSASEIAIIPAVGALIASEVMGTKKTGENSLTSLILAFLGALTTSKDKPKTKSKRKSKRKLKPINKGEPSDI